MVARTDTPHYNGIRETVDYESENVILENLTREYIVEKRLFPYIPFYIARYEKDITSEGNVDRAIEDLAYFKDALLRLRGTAELSDAEMIDLMGFVNTIITHIANGNKNEERLVNVMGGTIIETESEKWIRRGMQQGMQQGVQQGMQQGQAKMIVELGQDDGQDDETILKRLREKIGLSLEEAKDCLAKYGKQLV